MSSTATPPPPTPPLSGGCGGSIVSGLSLGEEGSSVASKRSVWSQAGMMLLGELPAENNFSHQHEQNELLGRHVSAILNHSIDEEDDDDDDDDDDQSFNDNNNNNYTVQSNSGIQLRNANLPQSPATIENPSGSGNNYSDWNDSTIQEVLDTSERLAMRQAQSNIENHNAKKYIEFSDDDPRSMTYSRRLALFLLQRYAWYNPQLKKDLSPQPMPTTSIPQRHKEMDSYPFTYSTREQPSLAKAWAYWDHVTLTRYLTESNANTNIKKRNIVIRCFRKLFCKADKLLKRAEPGEREYHTRLYSPLFTPHKQLGDFGLGLGLYFSTLRAIFALTLAAGLLNVPNLIYFESADYQSDQSNFGSYLLDLVTNPLLTGSAICTDVSWVVCNDCTNAGKRYFDMSRIGSIVETNQNATTSTFFYLRNNCSPASIQASMINYATLVLILVGIVILNMYLERMEVAYDEDEQTAQDYSVVIGNPPGDATDPEEWYTYFQQAFHAHVTALTIAVDNDLLIRSLVERRERLRKIELLVEPGTALDTLTLAGIAAQQERSRRFWGQVKAWFVPGIAEHFARVTVLNAKVQGLAQQDYPATNVFCTFETEASQRDVLQAFNLGTLDVSRNATSKIKNPKHLFRENLVLKVSEADEPNTVRWQDLNEKAKERLKQQLLTAFATLVAICLIALLVSVLNNRSVAFSAFGIAFFNIIFPEFAKFLTSLEAHKSEDGKQRSLYLKIALFRWANTAVVITIITPFTSTLTNGALISQIYALFFAEIVTTNFLQLLDFMGHINRHVLAPRATTQDAMNLKMQGQIVELAERYTNMTKLLFLALWYCAIYPGVLFMCSFSLLINYFMDRFALMRTWKRPPQLGTNISKFSRRYFFSLAVVAMAVMSSFYWAGFPFDNLCPIEGEAVNATFVGEWLVKPLSAGADVVPIAISINPGDPVYRKCLQDFLRFPVSEHQFSFPFIPDRQMMGEEWMTIDQEDVTIIFGWTAVGVILLVLLSFVYSGYNAFLGYFTGSYSPCGTDQNINFSDVPSINSYVPEVTSPVFSYPLLACNIDRIDSSLLEWTDPDRPHAYYDLTKDAQVLLHGQDMSSKVVFSQVAHWPPPSTKVTGTDRSEVDHDQLLGNCEPVVVGKE